MNEQNQTVSIAIGATMFARYADLPNTVSHALADFVDNALQSYRDNKNQLQKNEPEYRFKISIDFIWDETTGRAKEISITDNAGGLSETRFEKAFMTAETPDNNQGLNEFGMGMKTAAGWLGETWSVRTSALNEDIERFVLFNLNDVVNKKLKELPVYITHKEINEHYTIVHICDSTKNVPTRKNLDKIKTELASIYRKSLREKEIQLLVCGDELTFSEYPILTAPSTKTPNSQPIYWKKDINFKFDKYSAKGFIGILRDINSSLNGFVLLRRGRVVIGAEYDGRYFPKCLSGSAGTFRYKRLFGELELEGFEVSFNKNDIQDKENLDTLMEALKGEIHTREFDLYNQAEDYRLDDNKKQIKKIVTKHNTSPRDNRTPITIDTKRVEPQSVLSSPNIKTLPLFSQTPIVATSVIDEYKDEYIINSKIFTLKVQFVDSGTDLFWVDISQKSKSIIICQINTKHIFFEYFGKPNESVIALLKTIAIAKFTAKEEGEGTATDMFNYFNEYIKKTKV